MPENPQDKEDSPPEKEKNKPETPESDGAWSEDQKKRGYYYDDACGYEVYDPDDEDEN